MEFVPALRILCLHDANSNASELKDSLRLLGDRLYLNHGIDLVFVNSPLAVAVANSCDDDVAASDDNAPKRVWWHECSSDQATLHAASQLDVKVVFDEVDHQGVDHDEDDDDDAEEECSGAEASSYISATAISVDEEQQQQQQQDQQHSYPGLDASLLLLQQVWSSSPFIGILAVGQGAAIASLFCLLPTTFPPPRFCIFVHDHHTESQLLLKEADLLQESIHCLHVVSTFGGDRPAPHDNKDDDKREDSLLAKQFGGIVYKRNIIDSSQPSSSLSNFTPADLNAIGRFLLQQKRSLDYHSPTAGGDAAIVALQSALHAAQLQAADAIAERIAANPPAALMAVIRPAGEVAGWSGNKRRQANDEGGGAPCPSEFLLQREKRQGQGVSRQHPNQQE